MNYCSQIINFNEIMEKDEKDFGYELSEKSIRAFDAGSYLEAFFFQAEAFEGSIPEMIAGKLRSMGMSNTKIKKMAYRGTLEQKIDRFTELCGDEFSHLCSNLHEYRERRNKLTHRKSDFKDEEEMNNYARETWLLGTIVLSNFIESIKGFPGLE